MRAQSCGEEQGKEERRQRICGEISTMLQFGTEQMMYI
jgi:hypothetical protein